MKTPATKPGRKDSRFGWLGERIAALSILCGAMAAQEPKTLLSEQVELARLVDLCAQRLELNIQYEPSELKGTMTLRLGAGVTDEKLWALTNRLLATRGFASVQMPGEETLSIVRLNEAASLARVESEGLAGGMAGYVKIVQELKHRAPEEVLPALTLVLSKPGGSATALGRTQKLVIADLRPQMEQALEILALVDVPPGESVTEELRPEHVATTLLASQVAQVAGARAALGGRTPKGKLLPLEGGLALMLVAPVEEAEEWRELVRLLDKPEEHTTVSYAPGGFRLGDVGKLIEQVVQAPGAAGSGTGWRMITDELTGTLLITATPSQHRRVEELLTRLAEAPVREPVIEEIAARHVDPEQLVAQTERVASSRSAVSGETLKGKLLTAPSGKGVLLVAPPGELELWREMVARMDVIEPLETVSYAPKHYALGEVANLVREALRGPSTEPPEGLRIVEDELTQTLLVTATPSHHGRIKTLLERLESSAPATRRPMRSFVVKNRNAAELVELLQNLVGAGAVEFGKAEAGTGRESGAGRQVTRSDPLERVMTETEKRPGEQQQRSESGAAGAAPRRQAVLETEELALTADEGTNTLIAIGEAAVLDQLEGLLAALDRRQPQVMVEVLVVILTDSDTRDLGVELQKIGTSGNSMYGLASLFGLSSDGLDEAAALPTPGTGFTGAVLDPGDFSALITALEMLNEGRSLTIPKMLVNNNEEALLDSVLQTPFTSTNASDTVATTSFGGTLDAGTSVTVTPQIAEGDHLVLRYSVSLSQFTGDSSDPSLPPPRQQNSLSSVVTIPDGYTVALGGLDTRTEAEAISRVPYLGSIPLLGWLFQNRSTTSTRSRLFVFLRVNVLRHSAFEDLKYLSEPDLQAAGVGDGWPEVEPRWIR